MKKAVDGNICHDPLLRVTAEAKLADIVQNSENPSVQDYAELLQELRTHQLELEMQNEELRRIQMALETSHAHYIELYDFAPVGYLTLTADGIIAEINLTAAEMLGVERKHLINRRFAQFIADDYKDLWHRHFMQVKQSGGKHGCELPFPRENGPILYLHLDCLFIQADDAPTQLRITLTDVTQRKQTEKELHIAAVAFETNDSIIVTDANKAILRVNQAFTQLTGYTAQDVIGKTPYFLSSGLQGKDFYRMLRTTVANSGYWQGEFWGQHKNGSVFPVLLTITAITDAEGRIQYYVGSFTDITVQKQAEKILLDARERLQHQVASSQEELKRATIFRES